MKNIVGPPARHENFFPRNRELREILYRLFCKGVSILIDGPRRIGKTSIVFVLKDLRLNRHIYLYWNTEAIDNENAFFRKLYHDLKKAIGKYAKGKKLANDGWKFLQRVKSIHIPGVKVELSETSTETDYKEEVFNLLQAMELSGETQLVIILDEFPQTIQNILNRNANGIEAAKKFLQSNHELRTHPDISRKVKFIITGSIGLPAVALALDCLPLISDLDVVALGPLREEEAQQFVQRLLSSHKLIMPWEARDHMLKKIGWLSPYDIQLMMQQCIRIAAGKGKDNVTVEFVDEAFERILEERGNYYLEHYHTRLSKRFAGPDLLYVREVLASIGKRGAVSQNTIARIADRCKPHTAWDLLLGRLVYEGYVHNAAGTNIYRFNSPMLREWWKRFICK